MRLDQLTLNAPPFPEKGRDNVQEAIPSAQQLSHGVVGLAISLCLFGPAVASDVSIIATVDKTTVDMGRPITLTVTITGDARQLKEPKLDLPQAFNIIATGQSSNLSLRGKAVERSVSFTYVLVANEAGTFQLGPFRIEREGEPLLTYPIEIVVHKPALPPGLKPQGGYSL